MCFVRVVVLLAQTFNPVFRIKWIWERLSRPLFQPPLKVGGRVVRGAYISRAYIAISSPVYYFPFFSLYGRVLFGRLLASSFDAICARQLRTRFIALYTHKNELN